MLFLVLSACNYPDNPGGPTPTPAFLPCNGSAPCFLTRKGLISPLAASEAETALYYQNVDPQNARTTLAGWWAVNGFSSAGVGDVSAIYYNNADLRIGRHMNCKRSTSPFGDPAVACYVTNYGPPPFPPAAPGTPSFPDAARALSDAIAHQGAFATVAMEAPAPLRFGGFSIPLPVTFYIFGADGARINSAALDSEGPKSVPQMCMACHGGTYSLANHAAGGSSFLPFDVGSFYFSAQAGFTRADQEEAFRQLNVLVKATSPNSSNPHNPIVTLINGWYSGSPETPGQTFQDNFVPPAWGGGSPQNTLTQNFYLNFVAPYCRGCHIAVTDPNRDFAQYRQGNDPYQGFRELVNLVRSDVCANHNMPHAEVTYNRLWFDALGLPSLTLNSEPMPTPQPGAAC
jgi:hypothetical protein